MLLLLKLNNLNFWNKYYSQSIIETCQKTRMLNKILPIAHSQHYLITIILIKQRQTMKNFCKSLKNAYQVDYPKKLEMVSLPSNSLIKGKIVSKFSKKSFIKQIQDGFKIHYIFLISIFYLQYILISQLSITLSIVLSSPSSLIIDSRLLILIVNRLCQRAKT